MSTRQFRAVAAAVAVLTALGTVSACGGAKQAAGQSGGKTAAPSQVSLSPLAFLMKVATNSDQPHSAKMDSTMSLGTLNQVHATGAMAWGDGMQGNMQISQKSALPAPVSLIGAIYTHDAMYEHLGADSAAKLGGKSWLKVDYTLLAKQGAGTAALVDALRGADPTMAVKLLIAGGDVKEVGKENVRGVSATHYSGMVQAIKLVSSASRGLTAADLKFFKDSMAAQGVSGEQVDVWVDGSQRLVKKEEQAQATSGKLTSTVYYSDYGTAVDTTPPPAADTFDLQSIANQQGGTGSTGGATG